MIDLHYVPTMNGHKIAIMLEETGLPYNITTYNVLAGDHLTPQFHALNPNHKLPVIVDHEPADGGEPLSIFETGAILMYLAEKTGQFMPQDFRSREIARQWLVWQVAGMGPMQGQANHFIRYAPAGQDYAVARYSKESNRLMAVLESRLSQAEYLAGTEYSIADMACFAFASVVHTINVEIDDFPSVKRWRETVAARPAVKRVLEGKLTATPEALLKSDMKLTPEQWSNVFGDRMLAAAGLAATR